MNRKAEQFFDAITHLREDLVEEAQNYVFRKKRSGWRKFGSLAACVMLVVSLGVLAAMPKGCGGAAPSSNNMNASGTPAAPAEMPPDANGDAPSGDGMEYGDAAPRPDPAGEAPPAGAENYQFTAIVIEVQDEAILAEPIEYTSHDRVLIPFENLEFPALSEGDWITVTVEGGLVLTTDPPMVLGVQSIEKIDPE